MGWDGMGWDGMEDAAALNGNVRCLLLVVEEDEEWET